MKQWLDIGYSGSFKTLIVTWVFGWGYQPSVVVQESCVLHHLTNGILQDVSPTLTTM